jgi:GPH family glycoside/pentoside/hexuronide:cation symporter
MAKLKTTDGKGRREFGLIDRISYAAGDFGCNMSFALKSTLAIFWTQYMGLEIWYSVLLIIVQVWDAINDPLIGSLIDADRRPHKRNKFVTYISAGSIGLLVAGALCFLPIPEAPIVVQAIVFVAGYVIWDAFYTVANVPYGSLLSLISNDPGHRASLSAWRSVGSTLGNMVPIAVLPFIIYDKNNDLIGKNVFFAAIVMGILGFIAFRFMIRTTVIRSDVGLHLHQKQQRFNILSAMKNFIKNRPAMGATVAAMGMFLGMQGGVTAVTVLFQSYFGNAGISGVVQVFSMIPVIIFTPIAGRLVRKYGKKELSVIGAAVSVAASLAMLLLPITPDGKGVAIYVVCQLFNSLGIGVYSTVSWALMGDAIDYNQWKNGAREEGTTYALHSFFRKLSQGLGPSAVLIIMYALGYVGSSGAHQSIEVARNMRYLVAALYLISAVLQLVGLGLIYNLDKKTTLKMQKELGHVD